MYQPRPYGLHAVGGAPTDDDQAFIESLARRLTNLRQVSGVDSLRMVRTLPDGGYVIAQDMGGVFRIITHKPEPPPAQVLDGIAKDYVPMLFSGVVTRAILRYDEGVGLVLTDPCRRRIANYKPEQMSPRTVALQRFRIGYQSQVQEFVPQVVTELFYSQYAQQRPTWYSGAMAQVMQIVGGYGRQVLKDLPNDLVERARLALPDKVLEAIRHQMGGVRLPGYTGLPDKDGQFQYDYKFNNTHGVGFDNSDRPWLLRVDARGVWAMPLPLIPATTTRAFRDYMIDQGDQEVIAILDRFGGMPSGESFPVQEEDFEAWRRAGVVIRVCGTADFYDHIAYSTACGWSFNSRGSEGFNTCYDYYDDMGLGYGLAYKLHLTLGAVPDAGKLSPIEQPDDAQDADALNAYLSELGRLMAEPSAQNLAVKYKLRRQSVDALVARAKSVTDVGESELIYWKNLEATPIAQHSGRVAQVGSGYLYNGAIFKYQPQIKYPEPWQGGCVSHDFLPLENGRYKERYPDCDTIMFGYYIGDELKVAKYFWTQNTYQAAVDDNYEDCMIVGSWQRTVTGGPSRLMGNFYTTDFDERDSNADTTTVTSIVGKDRGYDSKPFFAFDAPFWKPGTMWRNRYYSYETKTVQSTGYGKAIGLCIPYLCRNAVLHSSRATTSGASTTETGELRSVQDPNTYRFWTYDSVMHWAGGLEVMNGKPYPAKANPVWVEMYSYSPGGCSDFADQGDWVGGMPADYTWLIHPKANEYLLSGGGGPPAYKAYTRTSTQPSTQNDLLKLSLLDQPAEVGKAVDNWYFLGSPDDILGVFYRDAARIVFGEATYANVSESDGGQRKRWGYTSLADHRSAHHFIGVINE